MIDPNWTFMTSNALGSKICLDPIQEMATLLLKYAKPLHGIPIDS